jgi:hypothetical protein
VGQDVGVDGGLVGPTLGLAWRLAVELADTATVTTDEIASGVSVSVMARNPKALSFGWTDFQDEIIFGAGEFGGRWELDGSVECVALVESLARAVIAGRVRETLALGRSRVEVLLSDGTVKRETGWMAPQGCLPLPFWPRWARTVQYEPFG